MPATFTVNDLGGGNDGGSCNAVVPIVCPCTDGSLTGCTIRAAARCSSQYTRCYKYHNFAGGLAGILELAGNTFIDIRDISGAMTPTNLVINGSTAITITKDAANNNNPLLRIRNSIGTVQ